jgi:hypothetical protein
LKKILLRKYNTIFKAKDAGVNRKRKPLALLCIIAKFVQPKQTTNKTTKRLYNSKIVSIVEEIRLQLSQV